MHALSKLAQNAIDCFMKELKLSVQISKFFNNFAIDTSNNKQKFSGSHYRRFGVAITSSPVSTGMGDRRYVTHSGQLRFLPSAGREISTDQSAIMF